MKHYIHFDKLEENIVSTTASNKDVSEPKQDLANFDEFEIFEETETEKIFSTTTSSNIKTKKTDQRPQTPLPLIPAFEPSDRYLKLSKIQRFSCEFNMLLLAST